MPSVGSGSMGSCGPDSFGTVGNVPCENMNASLQYFGLGGRSVHDALSYCNQYGLGAAAQASMIPRKDLFLMSMVPYHLLGYNNTIAAVHASLEQMQLDYLDLVMIHHRASDIGGWPREVCQMKAFPGKPAPKGSPNDALWEAPSCSIADPTWESCQDGSWEALLDLKKEGKIRAIGVSNWQISNLQRWKEKGYELPAVNQVEAHIGYLEDDLNDYCQQNGILLQAATPLSRNNPVLVKAGADPTVTALAAKYNKSAAQISLRYLIEKGISPIPSTKNPDYMKENLDLFGFEMTKDEVISLAKIQTSCRGAWNLGLVKCWADPGTLMCMSNDGKRFHCP